MKINNMNSYAHPHSTIRKMIQKSVEDKNTFNRELQEWTRVSDEHAKELIKTRAIEIQLKVQEQKYEMIATVEQKLVAHLKNAVFEEETYKKEKRLLQNELDLYLRDIKFTINKYSSNLGVHVNLDSCVDSTYQVQYSFFSQEKSDNYFLICEWNSKTKEFKLLEMKPRPKIFGELCKALETSNEIHQLLNWARKFFRYIENKN